MPDPVGPTRWRCHLCPPDAEPTTDPEQHLRVLHPDHYEPAERWPDGEVVQYDVTIEPHEARQ